jgi:predicted nucleic acid-binding protein
MTFLDSSTIIEYLRGNGTVIEYLDEGRPWWTSTICVFEVLNGPAGSEGFDPLEERQRFGASERWSSTSSSRSRRRGCNTNPSEKARSYPTGMR